jgi:glycosyltransferase involved in cell wall biosynthesis
VHMLAGEEAVVEEFTRRGLAATRVPTSQTGVKGAQAVARRLRSLQADCLLVDRPRDLRLGALAFLAHPLALINRYNLSRVNPPRDLLSRLAYLAVRLTIFVSETNARQALARAGYIRSRPYRVIPEGVGSAFHPDESQAARFRSQYGLDQKFILAVGSLTADKRYELLLEVMRRLGSGAPLLVVCGAGPLAESLRARAASLELSVRFLGLVDPEVLPGAYTAATAFVHACEIETFGLSVLEAMACGCPVVAVKGGAVPEVLGDAGILTPASDPETFCTALRAVLSDAELRESLARSGRTRAKRFSLEEMQRAYGEAIELIANGSAAPTRP